VLWLNKSVELKTLSIFNSVEGNTGEQKDKLFTQELTILKGCTIAPPKSKINCPVNPPPPTESGKHFCGTGTGSAALTKEKREKTCCCFGPVTAKRNPVKLNRDLLL
jgi:hypothetical protein